MYRYDQYDQRLVEERAKQFHGQVQRRLSGEVLEGEFKPLRLQNGLYMQLHAYMLRVAIPYGLLSSEQLRKLAHIARTHDKGYGHFTTRQNIQFNWPTLESVPKILEELASVQMQAIQTSGNCIRNTTSDQFAGVTPDEIEDPRPYAEIIRQWSTLHPEFAFLPRKFKIAVSATQDVDRAAVYYHDIGVRLVKSAEGEHGFEILVGGGLGRSPFIGKVIRDFLPKPHLLSYLEAILRVYNRFGRRDNKFKARIKILVNALGIDSFRDKVEAEWAQLRDSALQLTDAEVERVKADFAPPPYKALEGEGAAIAAAQLNGDAGYRNWVRNNVHPHKQPGYCAVTVSLKELDTPPGDLSDVQMDRVADLADRYSFGELRVTHTQNLVFADVEASELRSLYDELKGLGLHSAHADRISDMICCPGLDFCNLANARSIPIALQIMERFQDIDFQNDIGEINLKISGCINACGHHHVGHLGILGIDKKGVEHYQLMLGGSASLDASLGRIVGPAFTQDEIVDAVETVLKHYLTLRTSPDERFIDCYRRVGMEPFKDALYGAN